MSARYVSSQLIKNITRDTRSIGVEFVDKTTSWIRPEGFPSTGIRSKFTAVVEKNIDSLKPETASVAMKESEHRSDQDNRLHYTAFELDGNRNVIGTKHFVSEN